jgi:hypothetical protein
MILLYLSIPLMALGVAIALIPLAWAMRHQQSWDADSFAAPPRSERAPSVAAADEPEVEIGEPLLVGAAR